MSSTGQLIGLSGLNTQINHRQQRSDQMLALEKMNALKQYNQAQEEKYLMQEQAIKDSVREQRNKLLAGDQVLFNQSIAKKQLEVQNAVSKAGSLRGYYANGGLQKSLDYKNSVLDSPEFAQFKLNKINADKILTLQMKGFNDLIPSQDLKALNDHSKDPSIPITYHGLLNKIDIPEKLYANGKVIPLNDIVTRNKMNLIANFTMENPDLTLPQNPEELDKVLKSYAISKGYAGIGSNTKMIADDLAKQRAQKEKLKIKTLTGNFKQTALYISNLKTTIGSLKQTEEGKSYQDLAKTTFGSSGYAPIGIDDASIAGWVVNKGLDIATMPFHILTGSKIFNKTTNARFAVKYAKTGILNSLEAEKYLGVKDKEQKDDNGYINNLDLKSTNNSIYDVSGTQIRQDVIGDFKVIGTTTAYSGVMGADDNKKEFILMEAVNDKGEIVGTTNELYGEHADQAQLQLNSYIIVKNKKDETYYINTPMDSPGGVSKVNVALGERNKIGDILVEDTQIVLDNAQLTAFAQKKTQERKDKRAKLKEKQKSLSIQLIPKQKEDEIYYNSSDENRTRLWNSQVNSYNGTKDQTREPFMRAFYLTFNNKERDEGINENKFAIAMQKLGMEKYLKDYKYTDKDILNAYRNLSEEIRPELKKEIEQKINIMSAYMGTEI